MIAYLGQWADSETLVKLAERIVAYFGLDTLDILVQAPERLAEVDGIGPKRCAEIASQVRDQAFQRDALIFLQDWASAQQLANKIWLRYEEQTIAHVRENPYRLAEEMSGVGFRTADQIAQQMGFDLTSPVRAAAGIVHSLGRALDEGHVFLPRDVLFERLIKLLGEDAPISEELERCLAEGRLVEDRGIYLNVVYEAELELGERLSNHMDSPSTISPWIWMPLNLDLKSNSPEPAGSRRASGHHQLHGFDRRAGYRQDDNRACYLVTPCEPWFRHLDGCPYGQSIQASGRSHRCNGDHHSPTIGLPPCGRVSSP